MAFNIKDILRRLKERITKNIDFSPVSEKEKTERGKNLYKLREITKDYLDKHPNFKVPREFKDLIK